MMHFIWQHAWRIAAVWFLLSVVFLLVWVVVHTETPEQRAARRKRERAEAAKIHLRRVVQYHVQREQQKALRLIAKQGEDVFSQVSREFADEWYGSHDNSTEVDGEPKRVA